MALFGVLEASRIKIKLVPLCVNKSVLEAFFSVSSRKQRTFFQTKECIIDQRKTVTIECNLPLAEQIKYFQT